MPVRKPCKRVLFLLSVALLLSLAPCARTIQHRQPFQHSALQPPAASHLRTSTRVSGRHSFTSLAEFQRTGMHHQDPQPLSQVLASSSLYSPYSSDSSSASFQEEPLASLLSQNRKKKKKQEHEQHPVFLELGAPAGFCEVCIVVVQNKQRGEPHLCAGVNSEYFPTCVENLESILRADKALVYWLKNGCLHLDEAGPEIVRPCPALPICSWIPNLFARPPIMSQSGLETLCPKDMRFLPTIPEEYAHLKLPDDALSSARDQLGQVGPVRVTTSSQS